MSDDQDNSLQEGGPVASVPTTLCDSQQMHGKLEAKAGAGERKSNGAFCMMGGEVGVHSRVPSLAMAHIGKPWLWADSGDGSSKGASLAVRDCHRFHDGGRHQQGDKKKVCCVRPEPSRRVKPS